MDLRRHRRRLAAVEVRDQAPREAHLQPVELRARPLLPDPRQGARLPARVLVGADVAVDGARARDHRRRRAGDPPAGPPDRDRDRLLGHVCRRDRRDLARRARDDRLVPSRADHGRLLLVGADHLARGPGVHVLHDHRPEDDPERHGRAARLRGRHRAAVGAADVTADDRVRHEGRAARLAHPRLRGAAAARMGRSRRPGLGLVRAHRLPGPGEGGGSRRRRRGRRRGVRGAARPRRASRATERRVDGTARRPRAAASGDDPALARCLVPARPAHGAADRRRSDRRSPHPVRRASAAQRRPRVGRRLRRGARGRAEPDQRRRRGARSSFRATASIG